MTRDPGFSERDGEIDRSPLNCEAAGWRDSQVRCDARRLVIEPNRGYFRVAWAFLAMGGLGLPLVVLTNRQEAGRDAVWLVAGVLLAVGAALLALRRRFVFDREAGTLWMRPGLRARTVPLSEVRAIQVVFGGSHRTSDSAFASYQLNLVLGGGRPERVNVSNQPDLDWAVDAGMQLAAFLGVPLFEPTGRGARPGPERG